MEGQSHLMSWRRCRDLSFLTLVELTCTWDSDAKKAEDHKASKYTCLKIALYMIEVGACGHIIKPAKYCLQSLFRAWVPRDTDQVLRWILLVCSSAIFQARNDPVRFSPHLVTRLMNGMLAEELVDTPYLLIHSIRQTKNGRSGPSFLLVFGMLKFVLRRLTYSARVQNPVCKK